MTRRVFVAGSMLATASLLSAIFVIGAMLAAATLASAQEKMEPLHGTCSITASEKSDRVRLDLERDDCVADHRGCSHNDSGVPLADFSGFTLADLQREGAHVDADLTAEAGTLRCSGTVHDAALRGDYTFTPNPEFVTRMQQMGFTGFDSEKLQAYTLFHIETAWVQALKTAGVQDMDSSNLIALRIFRITPEFVHSMDALGYPHLEADKLIAFGVHGVNPDEVKQVRALGYNPNADELIQMRIFHVTPDFIRRMQDRGFKNLTIAKLVQVRIFKLAE
jgi:hypothetical protein